MKVAFLGATKGMGRALARRMAARGDALALLARDPEDAAASAADLVVEGAGGEVPVVRCDLADPSTFGPALDDADAALSGFDTVVVTAGLFATQDELEADRALADRLLTIDFVNTILFCEEARERLLARGGGTLCVFSSVAGETGRKPVGLYGAAKAGLSHYLQCLDLRHRAAGLRTVCVKPGFVRTGMTAHLKEPPFAGDPDDVARRVLVAIDRGWPVVHAPPVWRLVMAALRLAPRAVMRRVEF